jgi:uncharacterized membrane protein
MATTRTELRPQGFGLQQVRAQYIIYSLALVASISGWFIAVRAPLWLDETYSYWMISNGFSAIWPRGFVSISFPAYFCILWLSTKMIGISEIALRVPSILAMLGAVYLLYLAARELFEHEIAIFAAIIFCLHPIVVFASIDIRPYAFGVLATNAAILIMLRLRRNDSNWLAVMFGISAAWILYFHFLFGTILPALLFCFYRSKIDNRKVLWRQLGVALTTFALACLPVIPGLQFLFRNQGGINYGKAPTLFGPIWTFTPGWPWVFLALAVVVAVASTRSNWRSHFKDWQIVLCATLALVPLLTLYGISVKESMPVFEHRFRLVTVPGIALGWALLFAAIRPRAVRLLICMTFVATVACLAYRSPDSRQHGQTWKYALDVAEKNASVDNAPVLICSGFSSADNITMPINTVKENDLFTQLSYYPLSEPVVPLPWSLNGEAIRVGSRFLQEAAQKHQRFLALSGNWPYRTLDWLAQSAAGSYSVRKLGVFDEVEVLEFVPRTDPSPRRD